MRNVAMRPVIIFDLDGTLVDSCGVCTSILQGMVNERGFDFAIDPVHARAFMSRGGEAMVAELLGAAGTDPAADLVEFRTIYAATDTRVECLFDGVAEGLRSLHAHGFKLAICTNKPQGLSEKVLADTGIAPYFCAVVGSGPGLRPKPASDLLDLVMTQLGTTAERCCYVGDSELDHAVAHAAGMPFHYLTYGYACPDWEPSDCFVYDDFRALTQALGDRASVLAA